MKYSAYIELVGLRVSSHVLKSGLLADVSCTAPTAIPCPIPSTLNTFEDRLRPMPAEPPRRDFTSHLDPKP